MLADVRAGVPAPRHVLLKLNHDTGRADDVCGTLRVQPLFSTALPFSPASVRGLW